MSKILKRVPRDFDWPLEKVWPGYLTEMCRVDAENGDCDDCRAFASLRGLPISSSSGCPDFEQLIGPPGGEGYQVWETITEGSPKSPVFESLDDLCEWAETNLPVHAGQMLSKEQWKQELLKEDRNGGFIMVMPKKPADGFDSSWT